jgi:hypothetical protein
LLNPIGQNRKLSYNQGEAKEKTYVEKIIEDDSYFKNSDNDITQDLPKLSPREEDFDEITKVSWLFMHRS